MYRRLIKQRREMKREQNEENEKAREKYKETIKTLGKSEFDKCLETKCYKKQF